MTAPDSLRLRETFCPLTAPERFCPVPVPLTPPTPEQPEVKGKTMLPVTELPDWVKKPVRTMAVEVPPFKVTCQLPARELLAGGSLWPPHAPTEMNTPSSKITDKSLKAVSTKQK